MITFSSDDRYTDLGGGSDIRVTTAEEEYANQKEAKLPQPQQEPTFSRNGDIVLGVDDDGVATDEVRDE